CRDMGEHKIIASAFTCRVIVFIKCAMNTLAAKEYQVGGGAHCRLPLMKLNSIIAGLQEDAFILAIL
ncbi:hypothetical protein Tco_0021238, partial [Tanacetum coccineum]